MPPPDLAAAADTSALARARLRRLPGRTAMVRLRIVSPNCRLWLDDEHLVQDRVWRYSQEIQRFALGDIQALQLRRSVRARVYNIVLGAWLVCFALILWGMHDNEARAWVAGICVAPCLLTLIINLARGATCRATLTTVLGPQVLPSLSRMRPARRALALIRERIDAAQGTLQPEAAAREVDRVQSGHFNFQRPRTPSTPS